MLHETSPLNLPVQPKSDVFEEVEDDGGWKREVVPPLPEIKRSGNGGDKLGEGKEEEENWRMEE